MGARFVGPPTAVPPTETNHPAATRYRTRTLHRTGGLGEVYLADDLEVERQVALKQIREALADDPESRARFLAEAHITGTLEHPGIVPVYGLGQYANGRPFYAMRFIQGETLNDALKRWYAGEERSYQSVEFRNLLQRFIAVCQAVGYAHSRNLIHRDIKPNNIMLGEFGETLVVDWGLAKNLATKMETQTLRMGARADASDTWPAGDVLSGRRRDLPVAMRSRAHDERRRVWRVDRLDFPTHARRTARREAHAGGAAQVPPFDVQRFALS